MRENSQNIAKKSWTVEEDNMLIQVMDAQEPGKYGNWCQIAEKVGSRSGKQCRERYLNHLSPSIKHSPWNENEDRIIYKLHEIYQNNWCKYIFQLPGRSDNSIKNRWHMLNRNIQKKNKNNINNNTSSSTTTTTTTPTTIYRDEEKSDDFCDLINFYPIDETKVSGKISSSLSSSSSSLSSSCSTTTTTTTAATSLLIPIVHVKSCFQDKTSCVESNPSLNNRINNNTNNNMNNRMNNNNGTLSPVTSNNSSNDNISNISTTNDFMNVFNDEDDDKYHYLHFHINDSYSSNSYNLNTDDDDLFDWLE